MADIYVRAGYLRPRHYVSGYLSHIRLTSMDDIITKYDANTSVGHLNNVSVLQTQRVDELLRREAVRPKNTLVAIRCQVFLHEFLPHAKTYIWQTCK